MEKYRELLEAFDIVQKDIPKFYEKGVKAAGVRARKALLKIKKLAHELRKDISEKRKNM